MTRLVFGKTGQVATELQRQADVVALGRDEADLADPASCLKVADALGQSALATGLDIPGTYHFSGAPDVSWADFATEIFHQAGITCEVVAIPSSDYPTTAARPFNSRMACSTTQDAFGIPRPDWKQSLSLVLADLSESI
jgi:dTDP-4-dehydrorhamnose reductase